MNAFISAVRGHTTPAPFRSAVFTLLITVTIAVDALPAQAACGVYLAAGSWLSGLGTTVYSNCYQCTDLAERQYDATGWLEGHNFRQVAPTYGAESMIYADGSGWHVRTDVPVPTVSAYPGDGSYNPIPGDLVVMGAEWPRGGGAGHVAVVETVSGSSFGVVEQNPGGRATYTKTGSGWVRAGYTAKGFIHSSRNPLGGPPPPPPDRDGDGTPDASDHCPDQRGPADNHGCPWIGLRNASFEEGTTAGWGPGTNTKVNQAAYRSGTNATAREGDWYGATNTPTPGGSLAQELDANVTPGRSYTGSVWLRSATTTPFSGQLSLWGIFGNGNAEGSHTRFTVGPEWTLVSTTLSPARTHTRLKLEIYEFSTGQDLYLDGAAVGFGNAGFAATPPGQPASPSAKAMTEAAEVRWTAANLTGWSPIAEYQVAASPGDARCSTGPDATSCTLTGLTGGISHTFRVRARNGIGWSSWSPASNTVVVQAAPGTTAPSPTNTVRAAPTAPAAPTAVAKARITFPRKRTAVLLWTAPANASSYRVRVSKKNTLKKWRSPWTVASTSTRITDLKRHAVYRVEIVPLGPGGVGPASLWKFRQKK